MDNNLQRGLPWVLAVYIVVVFVLSVLSSLPGVADPGRVPLLLIGTVGQSGGMPGQFGVGLVELATAILIVVPRTQAVGALLALVLATGIVLVDVFSAAGPSDDGLGFGLACGVWAAALVVLVLRRRQLGVVTRRAAPGAPRVSQRHEHE